jgi:hypothetical protein
MIPIHDSERQECGLAPASDSRRSDTRQQIRVIQAE